MCVYIYIYTYIHTYIHTYIYIYVISPPRRHGLRDPWLHPRPGYSGGFGLGEIREIRAAWGCLGQVADGSSKNGGLKAVLRRFGIEGALKAVQVGNMWCQNDALHARPRRQPGIAPKALSSSQPGLFGSCEDGPLGFQNGLRKFRMRSLSVLWGAVTVCEHAFAERSGYLPSVHHSELSQDNSCGCPKLPKFASGEEALPGGPGIATCRAAPLRKLGAGTGIADAGLGKHVGREDEMD